MERIIASIDPDFNVFFVYYVINDIPRENNPEALHDKIVVAQIDTGLSLNISCPSPIMNILPRDPERPGIDKENAARFTSSTTRLSFGNFACPYRRA
jgi:hypothetical protein